MHQLEEASPDFVWSHAPTRVHRVAEDLVPPSPFSGVTPARDDHEPETNIFGHKVTKIGPTCSHAGFKGHKVEQCYTKHHHVRSPQGVNERGLKEGPSCSGRGSTRHARDKC